ncbi:UvrD-helicase domain-containing protein [Actinoplanes sp. NPDC049681]|uniref:UvrD-helicase domain-containing protein n=1 Tax=Actinoplanes sp. NPDC049681 TaxID=3363905 RepID=UPI0037ADCC79
MADTSALHISASVGNRISLGPDRVAAPRAQGAASARGPQLASRAISLMTAGRSVKPTDEQIAVIESCVRGANLVIEAGAGTGKTTTLEMAAKAMGGRGIYVAYNRSIVDNAQRRFPGNVKCYTAHQLAYESIGHRYASRLDGFRLPYRAIIPMLAIDSPIVLSDRRVIDEREQVRLAMQTVGKFCRSADDTLLPKHVPATLGVEGEAAAYLAGRIHAIAVDIWIDLVDPRGGIPFVHDHYLKMWSLTEPKLNCDYLLFDEAQDADPLIASILTSQQVQRIAVGDSHQAIYGWRGAVDALASWPAEERLYLLQSWRFGPEVADEANKWLKVLGTNKRLAGSPYVDSAVGACDAVDAVLCRTNAQAMREVLSALDSGLKPFLMGGGWEMRNLAEAAIHLLSGKRTQHRELYAFQSWDEVVQYAMNEEGGASLRPSVQLIMDYGPDTILKATDALVDEGRQDVTISTTHKVKGREWKAVRIADDFRRSSTMGNGKHQQLADESAMLSYVAVTRAQERLDCSALAWVDTIQN